MKNLIVAIAIVFSIGANAQTFEDFKKFQDSINANRKEVTLIQLLDQINQFRDSLGLAQVTMTEGHNEAAQIQADWVSQTGILSHTQTKAAIGQPLLVKPWDRGNWVGVEVDAENILIAYKYDSAEFIIRRWMNSPGHRAILLRKSKTDEHLQIGLAITRDKSDPNKIVVVFVAGDSI